MRIEYGKYVGDPVFRSSSVTMHFPTLPKEFLEGGCNSRPLLAKYSIVYRFGVDENAP